MAPFREAFTGNVRPAARILPATKSQWEQLAAELSLKISEAISNRDLKASLNISNLGKTGGLSLTVTK